MEFEFIDFRDSIVGRQAYIQGSSLAMWEVMMLLRAYKKNVFVVAKHLYWPEDRVQAAVHYATAFPDEINRALAENDAMDFESIETHVATSGPVRCFKRAEIVFMTGIS